MAHAVRALPDDVQEVMELREWDIRTREGIHRFKEIRCKSLPSIAINGELVFESIIPPEEDLIAAIRERRHGISGSSSQ
jgi:hypothetical protein